MFSLILPKNVGLLRRLCYIYRADHILFTQIVIGNPNALDTTFILPVLPEEWVDRGERVSSGVSIKSDF